MLPSQHDYIKTQKSWQIQSSPCIHVQHPGTNPRYVQHHRVRLVANVQKNLGLQQAALTIVGRPCLTQRKKKSAKHASNYC